MIGAGLWGLCVLVCVALFLSACVTGDSLVSVFKEVEDAMDSRYASKENDAKQGLTLVNFSAQLERFVWDRGCA